MNEDGVELEALENPPRPNKNLEKAFLEYKKNLNDDAESF